MSRKESHRKAARRKLPRAERERQMQRLLEERDPIAPARRAAAAHAVTT